MTVRLAERDPRTGHLWLHDRDDDQDHAMPRRHLIDATRRQSDTCGAACGHVVNVRRYGDATGDRACGRCAELAPRPSWWRRIRGAAS